MNSRQITIGCLCVLGGVLLWATWARQQRVNDRRLALAERQADLAKPEPDTQTGRNANPGGAAHIAVPIELLQLRNQVSRLSAEKRELAGAVAENQQLHHEIETRSSKPAASAMGGLTNYVRGSQAQWRGYNTPEDTLQSAIWAAWHHDVEKLLEAMEADSAGNLRQQIQAVGAEEFFKQGDMPPGYAIVGREVIENPPPDPGNAASQSGSPVQERVTLKIQIGPDTPETRIPFWKIGGQWKLAEAP